MNEKELNQCFYCNALVAKNDIELDHFPIPQRNGGIETVISCRTCHGMKDRFTFDDWSVEWTLAIAKDFPNFNRETKIFLAKSISLISDAQKIIRSQKQNETSNC